MLGIKDLVVKKIQGLGHVLISSLNGACFFLCGHVQLIVLVSTSVLLSAGVAHATVETTVVNGHTFTWVWGEETNGYAWNDVLTPEDVDALPGLGIDASYLGSAPLSLNYVVYRSISGENTRYFWLYRDESDLESLWSAYSYEFFEQAKTLSQWMDFVRNNSMDEITNDTPIGILVDVTGVPEPSTCAMLAAGLCAVSGMTWGRRRRLHH